jgi:hypothetical protein
MGNWFAVNAPPQAGTPPPPAPGGGSWFASNAPSPANGTADLTANTGKEPVYRMQSDDGTEAGVPYSKIATGPALHMGYRFTDPQEEARFLHAYLHDPKGSFTKALSLQMQQDPILRFYSGVGGEALKTLIGLGDFIYKALGQPLGQVQQGAQGNGLGAQIRAAAAKPAEGVAENLGAAGETVAEFAVGDEVLKMLPELAGAEKLKAATQIAKLAETHPTLAKVLQLGADSLRQGTVAGGQTFAKTGGNVGAATLAAGATTALAGTVGGALSATGSAVARRATTLEDVGGVATPVPAEVRAARMTPQQQAGQAAIRSAAQGAARSNLNELQESLTPPRTAPQARGEVVGGGGMLETQDANIARAHIENLNRVVDSPEFERMPPATQREVLEARADAGRQMAQYHDKVLRQFEGAARPNFEPIDVEGMVRRTGSFTEAAQTVEDQAVRGYEVLNDATGGKFNAVRQQLKDAWGAYKGASGAEAQQAAEKGVDAAEAQMTRLLEGLRGVVNDRELDGFNDAFRNAQTLHRVAAAVDGSFSGNAAKSARSWEYRGFDGGRLMNNLSRLERKLGRPAIDRVIGHDTMDTLYRVAELNRTQTQRARFGAAVHAIASTQAIHHLTAASVGGIAGYRATHSWEGAALGAVTGAGMEAGTRAVMNAVLTNPQIARHLIFALDAGARPENYGPLIGGLIAKAASGGER